MAVTSREPPPIRSIAVTEEDTTTVARLCRVMDLALLQLAEVNGVTPGDIKALAYLSSYIAPAADRLLDDFNALHAAGIFAPVRGLRGAPCAG